ncbi:MAG: DUF349 domain-containing protein [Bacteroidales bacterium]|nr:DUF349 domain-containing protein [Bacteroidales bacterium]MCF8405218.1 DUF349 domain-containing protein [Bacteroidales bacterium]
METKDLNLNPEGQEENSKKKAVKKTAPKAAKKSTTAKKSATKPKKEVADKAVSKAKKPVKAKASATKKQEISTDQLKEADAAEIKSGIIAEEQIVSPEVEAEETKALETHPEAVTAVEEIKDDKEVKKEEESKPIASPEHIEELEEDADDGDEDDEDEEDEHEEEIQFDSLSRSELVEMLEEQVTNTNITEIKKKVSQIKVAFLKINNEIQHKKFESFISDGGEKEGFEPEKDELEERFNVAFNIYKRSRKNWLEEQEKEKAVNLETKKLILEELKLLIESEESLKKTYDEFRILQEKWRQVGMVPKSEVNNLWQSYHFYVEKFFDKVKINNELRDLDMKKNMESKIELCEKAEELLLETSPIKSFKQLQDYHRQWKDVGPVPQDKRDDLWERFKSTSDKINERRREHYLKLRDGQKNNLIAKTALSEKAEELLTKENESIKEWQASTNSISELLKVWKTIGPAPRKENDEIWERFKTSLDNFFEAKKEFFNKIKEEQLNNYNLKLDLCAQAESIKSSTDWRNTTQELINLQKEWKEIGPVPKKHSDKIWKRFRAACDEFFNSKSEYFSNIKQHEADNLSAKEELIKKVESFEFDSDKNQALEQLKGLQREWTEIGHVPFKDKDRLQVAFRKAINNQLDKLKINKAEMQTANYKERFETIKEKPNSNRIINNERNFLINKRNKMEDEVKLWENNMGFLAESKKASLLKEEFEKKIEKVRAEIEVINEKIRFLERGTE